MTCGKEKDCPRWTARRPAAELAAVAVALFAVAVRSISWRQCFRDGEALPFGVDGSYHLWRAEMLAAVFPRIPIHDPFVSFPQGATVPWPPGLDLIVALPSLFGFGPPAMAAWGAVLMALLGGLAVYLLYRLGKAAFGPAVGLLAAFFLALMPGAVSDTFVGRIDHHALVAPVTLGIFLCFLASARGETRERELGWGVACGLLSAAAVVCWPVSPPLFFLPVPLTLLILRWTPRRQAARRMSLVCLGSAFSFVLIAVVPMSDLANRPFDLYQPSLFIAVPYLLAALLVPSFLSGWKRFLGASVLVLALPAAALFFHSEWLSVLRQAAGVASGKNLSYMMAAEALPLLSEHQVVNLNYATQHFTYLVLLAPFFFLAYAWGTIHRRDFSPPRLLFGAYFFVGFGLMVFQSRFREFAAPAFSLLLAWALAALVEALLALRRHSPSRRRTALWMVLAALSAAAALAPLATDLLVRMKMDQFSYAAKVYAFGRDFAAADLAGIDRSGGFGLLSSWSDAHRLLHTTRLPVMASSFGTADAQRSNAEAFRILLTSDEEDAYRRLRKNRIRYVVVSSIFSGVEGMARMAGLSEKFVVVDRDAFGSDSYKPLKPFFDSLHSRLYLGYGSTTEIAGYRLEPLSHFRLLSESEWGEPILGMPKTIMAAFEAVQGGRVRGRTRPLSPVVLSLDLLTNLDRRFRYVRRTVSDREGEFEFSVPYSTDPAAGRTRAVGPYRVEMPQGILHTEVSERDVRQGRTVTVN